MRIHKSTWLAGIALLTVVGIIILADRRALPGFITRLYAFPYGDKVGHFLLMGMVAFFVNLALHSRTWPSQNPHFPTSAQNPPLPPLRKGGKKRCALFSYLPFEGGAGGDSVTLLLGSLCVALLVTLEEFSQLFFPSRSFDLIDLAASLLGIIVLGRAALLFKK